MADYNPSIPVSSLISDVENRLGNPNISTNVYLPWVSYAYLKTYAALSNAGQGVKEKLFGAFTQYTLTNGTAEYTLSTILPRFASPIKFEILYGASGDQRVRVNPASSIANWTNQGNVSTSYRAKQNAIYYLLKDKIGFIPTPPSTDTAQAVLYAWYVEKPFQITDASDIINLEYRFIYPMVNYMQAKAVQKEHEDYTTSFQIENLFKSELENIAEAAASEFNENDGESIVVDASSPLFDNPFGSF